MLDKEIQYGSCINCNGARPIMKLVDPDSEDSDGNTGVGGVSLCLDCLRIVVEDFKRAKPIKVTVQREVILDMDGVEIRS